MAFVRLHDCLEAFGDDTLLVNLLTSTIIPAGVNRYA